MSDGKNFFADSSAYDAAMGRLSRVAGAPFLDWLALPAGMRWLDVGCGSGAFTGLIARHCAPAALSAVDPVAEQIAFAESRPGAEGIDWRVGDALDLPWGEDAFDVAVMALVIQYVPDRERAMAEMRRVVRPGGTVAAYVWPGTGDGHPMDVMNQAARSIGVSPRRGRPGNAIRTTDALVALFEESGLADVESCALAIEVEFRDFDDYWTSQSHARTGSMTPDEVARLERAVRERLPGDKAGRIRIPARANAIRARVPG